MNKKSEAQALYRTDARLWAVCLSIEVVAKSIKKELIKMKKYNIVAYSVEEQRRLKDEDIITSDESTTFDMVCNMMKSYLDNLDVDWMSIHAAGGIAITVYKIK